MASRWLMFSVLLVACAQPKPKPHKSETQSSSVSTLPATSVSSSSTSVINTDSLDPETRAHIAHYMKYHLSHAEQLVDAAAALRYAEVIYHGKQLQNDPLRDLPDDVEDDLEFPQAFVDLRLAFRAQVGNVIVAAEKKDEDVLAQEIAQTVATCVACHKVFDNNVKLDLPAFGKKKQRKKSSKPSR